MRAAWAFLAMTMAAAAGPGLAEEAAESLDLRGHWGGEAEHAGEQRRLTFELSDGPDGPVARLSIPSIGIRDLPVGPWRVEGRKVLIGRSLELAIEGDELRGVLPETLVPVYRIPFALRRLAGPDPAPPQDARRYPGLEPVWTAEVGAPVWAGLARDAAHRLVLAATDAGTVVALSEATGAVAWTSRAGGAVRARPTVNGGRVYVTSDDGYLYALEARTGRRVWRAPIGQGKAPRGAGGAGGDRFERYASAAVVAGGRIYVGGRDGQLHAFDAATGRPRWRAAAGDVIAGAPAVAGGLVIFGSFDGHVRAVDARDGRARWDVDTRGAIASDVVATGGRVLVGTRAYELWGLEAATGASAWRRYVWFSWIESPPVVRDGIAYHGSSDALRAFAVRVADGRTVWEAEMPGWSWAQPAVAGDLVLVANVGSSGSFAPRQGALLALDRATGDVRWLHPSAPAAKGEWGFAAAPLVAGTRAYAADLRGRVLAFDLRRAASPPG